VSAERKEFAPCNPKACAQCPWRIANHGRPHPHGFYRLSNLRRLWNGLRRGARMSCHPTDPTMAEFEGYERTAARAVTYECTGAVVLIQREMTRFQQLAKESVAAGDSPPRGLQLYRAASGTRALTREGLAEHAWTMLTGGGLFGQKLKMGQPDLSDPEIGHPDLPPWGDGAERNILEAKATIA
jgi:hypothetical protein